MVSLSVEKGRRSAAAPPVGHPTAGSATLGIGLGLGVGWRLDKPRLLSPWPPPPYRHCATGAHQPNIDWTSPIRTRDQSPHLTVGQNTVEIKQQLVPHPLSALGAVGDTYGTVRDSCSTDLSRCRVSREYSVRTSGTCRRLLPVLSHVDVGMWMCLRVRTQQGAAVAHHVSRGRRWPPCGPALTFLHPRAILCSALFSLPQSFKFFHSLHHINF
jgi:hypothetical protein